MTAAPTTCAKCAKPICGHTDAIFAGTVVRDDQSEPGSWARALRHQEQTRGVGR